MKNCHLLGHKIATFTFLSLMALEASTGWATTIQGNLEVKARSGSNTANGNLTVKGNTTLKGNTILGNQASNTITINGSITADGDLTVDGDLTIQSVDSGSGGGVVINIDNGSDNDTIPTTQAVKDYIDSTTPASLYHSNPDSNSTSYSFQATNSDLWRLTKKDDEDLNNNVSKQIFPGERLIYIVHLDRRKFSGDFAEIILTTVPCNVFVNQSGHRKQPEHYAFNRGMRTIAVLSYYKETNEPTETLNFCAYFWDENNEGQRSKSNQSNFDVTYVHIAKHKVN